MKYLVLAILLLVPPLYADDGIGCRVTAVDTLVAAHHQVSFLCPPKEIFAPLRVMVIAEAVTPLSWDFDAGDFVNFRGGSGEAGVIEVRKKRFNTWYQYRTQKFRFIQEK